MLNLTAYHKWQLLLLLSTVLGLNPVYAAEDDFSGELLLFPAIDAIYNTNLADSSDLPGDDFVPNIDFFASVDYKEHLRFLGEFFLDKEEHEIERIQFGWKFDRSMLWLGRFHNPIGDWNTRFHHGLFLQTTRSRPGYIEFEDDDGLLPIHLGGLLFEGNHPLANGNLGFAFALGAGPEMGDALEPWNALRPLTKSHGLSTTLNLYLQPDLTRDTLVGAYLSITDIPVQNDPSLDNILLTVGGIYGIWDHYPWRISSNAILINGDLDRSAGSENESLLNAFVQVEYGFLEDWTVFGRLEGTAGDDNNAYLALFPGFVEDRLLGGLRFDIGQNNALTFEASHNHASEDEYGTFILQWSAVY